jgi:hypothetical protein
MNAYDFLNNNAPFDTALYSCTHLSPHFFVNSPINGWAGTDTVTDTGTTYIGYRENTLIDCNNGLGMRPSSVTAKVKSKQYFTLGALPQYNFVFLDACLSAGDEAGYSTAEHYTTPMLPRPVDRTWENAFLAPSSHSVTDRVFQGWIDENPSDEGEANFVK